ncbi:MAG: ubiquinol-cytochrome c reductase iron-sulfur subunit [Granulosicoccaceae bacterium]
MANAEQGSLDLSDLDPKRRRFLTASVSVVGAAGVVGLAVPMLKSFAPSARARAAGAPVEVDISKLEPGQMMTVEWRGKPVWLVNRTPEALASLATVEEKGLLADPLSDMPQQPEYAVGVERAINPQIMVLLGVCTHLGCAPTYRPEVGPPDLGADWFGGFFCPCHGSKFDFSGRVYAGVPAPVNLEVPPHKYLTETQIVIGEDQESA